MSHHHFVSRHLASVEPQPLPGQLRSTALTHSRARNNQTYLHAEHFRAYATLHALPSEGGPLADGYAFARHLQSERLFPEAARGELLTVQLRYRATARGLVRRRGPVVRLALLRRPFRLILAIRLPWLGERLLRFG
jgi:hypothetical protein